MKPDPLPNTGQRVLALLTAMLLPPLVAPQAAEVKLAGRGCNLYNGEDLPAAPFRTDDWPTHR